ncbi:MAG: orotate phosphoribosyltransferase [Bacteroidetes bacterium]|nr:MAG: orotate phosphoribosyltransferase [Bacteroidota bacterium]
MKTAEKTAESLLKIQAVKLNKNTPFTWASGWKSPIYCDNRKTLSYPEVRSYIRDEFAAVIEKLYPNVDVIAGVATGAIANGALVAEKLNKPFVYVRPDKKSHGMKNQVEGALKEGQTVVVIEDLISTGGSSLKAVDALRDFGCKVEGMVAIFSYGFEVAEENFKEKDVDLTILTDYNTMINQAKEAGYVSSDDVESLKEWRLSPSTWGK